MLPVAQRLRRHEDFAVTVRQGRRFAVRDLVVHQLSKDPDGPPARAGFVVGRAVGGAVVRNRVRRRLQHVVADRIASMPPGVTLVVRAQPSAADRSSRELADQLDRVLAGYQAVSR